MASTVSNGLKGAWQFSAYDFFMQSVISRGRVIILYFVRKIPYARFILNKGELRRKLRAALAADARDDQQYQKSREQFPQYGILHADIVDRLRTLQHQFERAGDDSYTKHTTISTHIKKHKRPLFPQLKAEVIDMCRDLYHGKSETTGTITTDDIGNIRLICTTYRDHAKDKRGIHHPEMIIPSTAADAYKTIAQELGIKLIVVPIDPETQTADVQAIENAITANTIFMVALAPSYPTGNIDPIESLSEIALRKQVGLHVDATAGGFLLPLAAESGVVLPKCDFSLGGVSSISLNINRDGKPSGPTAILYRTEELAQYKPDTDPNESLEGMTCPDSELAKVWASMVYRGRTNYIKITKAIFALREELVRRLTLIDGIEVAGDPKLGVIAIQSKTINPHAIGKKMKELGWPVNNVYHPPRAFNICLSAEDITKPNFADNFMRQLLESIKNLQTNNIPEQYASNVLIFSLKPPKLTTASFILDLAGDLMPDHTLSKLKTKPTNG